MKTRLLDGLSVSSKTIKSVGLIGISNIIFQGIGFVTTLILAWLLSKEAYGYIRYVIQMGSFIVMFVAAGYGGALTRFIAANRKEAGNYLFAVLIIVITSFFILGAIFFIFKIDMFIYLIAVGYSIPLIYYGVIRGFIDYKKIAAFNILRSLIKLFLISLIFVLAFLKTPLYIIFSYAFGGWVAIFIIEIFKRTEISINFKNIKRRIIIELTKFSLFSVLSNVFFSSLLTVGYFLLEHNYGYGAVAEYSMAITLGTIYMFIPGAVNTLLMPKVADKSMNVRIKLLKQAVFLNELYILLLYILVILFGKWGLELLFGNKYLNSYYILLVISIGYVFMGLETAFGAFWGGVNKPEYAAITVGIAAGVNLAVTSYLVNVLGPMGVPWGYVIAISSTSLSNYALYRKFVKSSNSK